MALPAAHRGGEALAAAEQAAEIFRGLPRPSRKRARDLAPGLNDLSCPGRRSSCGAGRAGVVHCRA